jgi:hypothetical protein
MARLQPSQRKRFVPGSNLIRLAALNTDNSTEIEENPSPFFRDYAEESGVLLVSFSGLKRSPEKIPGFSLRRVFEGLPAKKLYVRDLDKAWFLRGLRGVTANVDETAAWLRAEAASVQARRVVFTGYSLGGFAALLYGILCGADEVHAISPQTFISFWKRLRSGDHRWRRYVLPMHFGDTRRFHDLRPWLLKEPTRTQLNVYFARDSRLDALHVEHVRGLPRVAIHERSEGSHRLVTAMRDSGELRTLFERAIQRT